MDTLKHVRIYRRFLVARVVYFAVLLALVYVFSGEWQLILFSTNDPLLAGLQVLNNLIVGVFASSLLAYFLTQSSYVVRLTRDIVAFSNDLQDIGELYSNGCGADLCMELGGAHSIEKAEYREACFCFKTDKGSDFDMHDAYGEAVRLVSDLNARIVDASGWQRAFMTAFEGEGEAYEAVFDRISRGSSLGDADVRQLLGEASKRKDEGCVAIEKRDMAMEEARHIACEILALSNEVRGHAEYPAGFPFFLRARKGR